MPRKITFLQNVRARFGLSASIDAYDRNEVDAKLLQLNSILNTMEVVNTIAARDALPSKQKLVWVIDATGDITVASGGAMYGWNVGASNWIKITEAESLDLVLSWNNLNNIPSIISAIASITGADNDIIQKKSGTWVNRTIAQLKTDLAMAWGDISGKPSLFSGNYEDLSNKPSIPSAYSLPTASDSTLGGVKIGSGLAITDGVLSVAGGSAGTVVTITASGDWTVPAGVSLLRDIWIIAGGGSGSKDHGAGGGAGGVKHLTNYAVTPGQVIPAVVGAGGVWAGDMGVNGGHSIFNGMVAIGGGGAGGGDASGGGSGGGGSYQRTYTGGTGVGGQGWQGGNFGQPDYGGGGGGGYSSGGLPRATGVRADGGDGIDLSAVVGTSIGDNGWFAGGGGGGVYNPADNFQYGRGGKGGGGDGGHTADTGRGGNGLANTGSGGGGASLPGTNNGAGNGAAGIIIIRY